MTGSITLKIAQYAASTTVEKIPTEVKERAKQIIFDEVACAQFGRRSPAGGLAARYAASFGGHPEASILGTKLRVSAPFAAMANGTAGHGEELDGAHVQGGHPGASIVHAALAMAERQRASGEELLNAVVLGYDIGARVMQACGGIFRIKSEYRLHADFLYALGATAACCRLLGLDPTRMCHAFALTTFQANGLKAMFQEKRHISKSFCNGQYAFAGVSAALMAAIGLEGNEEILASPEGLLDAWGIESGAEIVTRNLGQDFAVKGANFKFFNAGYPIHAPVEAAMALVGEHGIGIDHIQSLRIGMNSNTLKVVDSRQMHNICIQDVMSAVLILGRFRLDASPFPNILSHPDFPGLRGKITLEVDPALERDQPTGRGANVTITTKDGASVSRRIDHPKGHSLRGGVTWQDLLGKWQDILVGCDPKVAANLAEGLENLDDVAELTAAFGTPRTLI